MCRRVSLCVTGGDHDSPCVFRTHHATVHGYKELARRQERSMRELALASVSVSADLGITLGSVAGLFMQACIYKWNQIPGAQVNEALCLL